MCSPASSYVLQCIAHTCTCKTYIQGDSIHDKTQILEKVKAKQHKPNPKAVIFTKKNELPWVGTCMYRCIYNVPMSRFKETVHMLCVVVVYCVLLYMALWVTPCIEEPQV